MKVLVLGSGAREHALVLAALKSPRVSSVICAPGNAGISEVASCFDLSPTDAKAVVQLAKNEAVSLVIVGPEAPLVAGVADALRAAEIAVFGPGQHGAQLEGSKAFSKRFMQRHGVTTSEFAAFTANEMDAALRYLRDHPGPIVVKADGLAAGKGVIVADTTEEAEAAVRSMLEGNAFGTAGASIVIEQRLTGPEISLHVLTDGNQFAVVGAAQDHKRLGDADTGPNTGGMGAYAPVAGLSDERLQQIVDEVVRPTIAGLSQDKIAFRGVLFLGIMLHNDRAFVLEYNVRFGDPETAVLMARMDGDIIPALYATATGTLDPSMVPPQRGAAMAVVMASRGYPTSPKTGDLIGGLLSPAPANVTVLHAGTKATAQGTITAGGRVLTITAVAPTFALAADAAYQTVASISFDGAQYRRDIGWRARNETES